MSAWGEEKGKKEGKERAREEKKSASDWDSRKKERGVREQ